MDAVSTSSVNSDTKSIKADSDSKNAIIDVRPIPDGDNNAVFTPKQGLQHNRETDADSIHSDMATRTVSSHKEEDTVSVRSKVSAKVSAVSANSSITSLSSANSIIPGVLCTPCFRNTEERVAAVKYCVDCTENYCKPCLRKHIKSNATKTHKLMGKDEMPDFSPNGQRVGLDKCSKHADLDLDNYCEQHQMLCCDKCAYLEHGACDHIIDLITASREVELEKERSDMQDSVTSLIDALTTTRNNRQTDQQRTRQNTANSLSAIREFRKEINDILDKLHRGPIDVINSTCLEEDNQVNTDIKSTNELIDQLQDCSRKLRIDACPDTTKFAFLTKAKEVRRKAEHCQESIVKNTGKDLNVFVVNKKVIDAIKNIKSIGEIRTATGKIQIDFQCYFSITDFADENGVTSDNSSNANEGQCNTNDTVCDIQGLTQLGDGRIVVADYERKYLMIFSNDFTFERKLQLGRDKAEVGEPFGLCRTGACQIAVSMTRDKVVDIIDLQDTGTETLIHSEIDVGEYCRGVAYSYLYDELFVACGGGTYMDEGLGHVRVFDLQGKHLRSLKRPSEKGNLLLPHPLNIAVSPDGASVYVTDREKGVATIDRHGKHVTYLCCPELQTPKGVCLDTAGRVIVTCEHSSRLVQVSKDGDSFNVLTLGTSQLQHPSAVCFDEKKSRIIVSMASSGNLAVYKCY